MTHASKPLGSRLRSLGILLLALFAFGGGCHSGPQASAPGGDCAGPGRYEAGKGQPVIACCQGLHSVELLSAVYEGGKRRKVCAAVPAHVYACVKGSCGDGTCEAGEAAPCGCPVDCPSSVWEGAVTQTEPEAAEPETPSEEARIRPFTDPRGGLIPRNTRGAILCGDKDCIVGRELCIDSAPDWHCVPSSNAAEGVQVPDYGANAYACDDGTDCPQGETCCLTFASASSWYACSKRRGPQSDCRVEICAEGGARCPKGQTCRDGTCDSPKRAATCGAAGRCPSDRPLCRWSETSARCATYAEFLAEPSEERLLACTQPSDCGPESHCCTTAIWDGTQCVTNCDESTNAEVCSTDADCTIHRDGKPQKGKCKVNPEAKMLPPWLKLCDFD